MDINHDKELLSVRSYNQTEIKDEAVFEKDLLLLSSQWNFIDHVSRFEKVGDFKVYDLLGESIIVVKTEHGFKGHFNFCSHRGSVLCTQNEGNKKAFVCPYHSWSFELDGKLRNAPACPSAKAEPEKNGLKSVEINEIEGLLFAGLNAGNMTDFAKVRDDMTPYMAWQGLKNAKVVCNRQFTLKANWKLAFDNFAECYHCYANHPEMCEYLIHPKVTGTDSADQFKQFEGVWFEWMQNAIKMGHPTGGVDAIDTEADQFSVVYRTVLNKDTPSYAKEGGPLAPVMGKFKSYDNGEIFGYCGPLMHYSMPTDHAFVFRLNPVSISETVLEMFWLVDDKANEDIDYDVEKLTWFWNTTIQQDIVAIERAAKGTSSKFYQPGRYTKLEKDSARFATWYRRMFASLAD